MPTRARRCLRRSLPLRSRGVPWMKRTMLACLVLGLVVICSNGLEASGLRSRCNDCAPADCNVTYVDKEVTCYKTEVKTRVVPMEVCRVVAKTIQEQYKYVEMVPECHQEKRMCTTYKC